MMMNSIFRTLGVACTGITVGYLAGTSSRMPETGTQVTPVIAKNAPAESIPLHPDFSETTVKSSSDSSTHLAISRAEVEAVMSELNRIPSMEERRRRFREVMRAWAESDGQAALTFALNLPKSSAYLKLDAIAAAAHVLAARNPAYLKQIIAEMPESAIRQTFVLEIARQGPGSDLTQTLAWAEALPQDRARSEALRILRSQLAHQNPEEAARTLGRMPEGSARQNLAQTIATEWGLRDPHAAAHWIAGLSAAEWENAVPALAASWSQADAQASGEFVANLPSGEIQERAAMSVMASWAIQNPKAAGNWAMNFPEGNLRDLGVREVVNSWTSTDPVQAFEWVKQIPAGNTRDTALRSYAEGVGYWSPEQAVTVTNLIEDQVQREASVESVMRSWAEVDPAAARSWLAKQNFRFGLQNRLSALFVPPGN